MSSELETRKSIGGIVAKILGDVLPNVSGLEESLSTLRSGDLTRQTISQISAIARANDPRKQLQEAINKYFSREIAQAAKLFIETGNYQRLIHNLFYEVREEDLAHVIGNPFENETNVVARRLVGVPITCIYSVGSVESGLVTEVAAYNGIGDEHLSMPSAEPGTIGRWYSAKRGGYNVATVTAHLPGEKGYVAIWEVVAGNRKLPMDEIANKFGFLQLENTSAVDPKSQLKITPHSEDIKLVAENLIGKAAPKKGAGCTAAYKLSTT